MRVPVQRLFVAAILMVAPTGCQHEDVNVTSSEVLPAQRESLARFPTPSRLDSSGPDSRPMFSLMPIDLTTSTFDAPLVVNVNSPGIQVEGSVRDFISRNVQLVTWPEKQLVPARVEYFERDTTSGRQLEQYVLSPERALIDRWYALVASPEMMSRYQAAPELKLQDGVVVSRFRVGRQLIVRQVQACSAEGETRIQVEFSERVRGDATLAFVSLAASGRPISCTSTGERLDGELGASMLQFSCPMDASDEDLSITIGHEGLRALGADFGLTDMAERAVSRVTIRSDSARRGPCRVISGDEV